jgi:uncharacterized membrane protein
MDWELFIGRFHPLMVHLPIGIFILGFFFEVLLQLGFRNLIHSRKIIIVTYVAGLSAGLVAALTGWLLSFSDDYGIEQLDNHKQLGIAALVVMLLVIIYQIKAPASRNKLKLVGSTLAIILIGLTGHFGGNLTHGSTYLVKYGPDFLVNDQNGPFENLSGKNPDSLKIYSDIIYPLLENKCMACHNTDNNKGGLILVSYGQLFNDADHEKPVVAGNPDTSELFKRVSLPGDHEKVMPPRGAGFAYTDIQILRYWIENGADSLATFNSENMTEELIALINRDYGIDYSPKPYYEKVRVDSLDEVLITTLRTSGFRVNYLGETNFLLDLVYNGDSIGKDQVQLLNQVADQITFLKLANCKLSDNLMEEMPDFPHLTRIDLSKNQLSGKMIPYLIKHPNLESVNLNETLVSHKSLQDLLAQSNLLRVYIWKTPVSPEEISNLAQTYEDVELISEFRFQEVVKARSVFSEEGTQ